MIVRCHLRWALALGMIASGLGVNSVFADDGPGHAAGHDHDVMKAEKKISKSLESLSPEDRKLAEAQRFCPMMEYSRLGAMGTPVKLVVKGKAVFVCCKECIDDAKEGGQETVKTVQKLTKASGVLAKLPPKDRTAAEAQKYCAVQSKSLLGSMGAPLKLELDGKPVYLCCKGCSAKAKANPGATLDKANELKEVGLGNGHDHAGHKKGADHSDHKN